jgi:3-deoxy-D-manno-octulosonic-acid transferase
MLLGLIIAWQLLWLLFIVLGLPFWGACLLIYPKTRAGLFQKASITLPKLPPKTGPRIWIHTVSVGEFQAVKPLLKKLLDHPYDVVVSTTTATGQKLAQDFMGPERSFYFPLDFLPCVARIFSQVQPDHLLILETEIWPTTLWWARHTGCQTRLINARLSDRSYPRYHTVRYLLAPILNLLTTCMAQSQEDAERFSSLGLSSSKRSVMGNLKFDIDASGATPLSLASHLKLSLNNPIITFASTHNGEEALFLNVLLTLKQHHPDLIAIVAPRHPERAQEVLLLAQHMGLSVGLHSVPAPGVDVIILDSVGDLLSAYGLSTVAVLGGSFIPWGGHNPLEALAMNCPVLFGPHMHNFKAIAHTILEAQAARQVLLTHLAEALDQLLTSQDNRKTLIQNGRILLDQNHGATQYVLASLKGALEGHSTLYP